MSKIKKIDVGLLGVIIILFLAVLVWRTSENRFSETKKTVPTNKEFDQAQRLEGKWVRPDGGYTLVIEDVKPDGSLKASYFNPKQINVFISNWKVEDNRIHLFIELRDINYPGSTYALIYVNEQDVLTGAYFQAVEKQTFSIKFLRIPEGQN